MIETTLALLSNDIFAAIDYLNRQSNPKEVIDTYNELVVKLYWEKKNLPAVVSMAVAGIQYTTFTARSQEAANPQVSAEFLGTAKSMAFNLASFTWPGWDEPGIVVGQTDKYIGFEAAKTNLRLAKELSCGDLPLCRAHWMLGAHYLSIGLREEAKQSFDESVDYARRAQEKSEELLALGYSLITTLIAIPMDESTNRQWAEIKAKFEELENGQDFIAQLTTALKVFS